DQIGYRDGIVTQVIFKLLQPVLLACHSAQVTVAGYRPEQRAAFGAMLQRAPDTQRSGWMRTCPGVTNSASVGVLVSARLSACQGPRSSARRVLIDGAECRGVRTSDWSGLLCTTRRYDPESCARGVKVTAWLR